MDGMLKRRDEENAFCSRLLSGHSASFWKPLHQGREIGLSGTGIEGLRVQQGILMMWLEREGCILKLWHRKNLENEIQLTSEDVKTACRENGTLCVRQDGAIVREEKATEQKRQVKSLEFCGFFWSWTDSQVPVKWNRDKLNHTIARSR